ncbi:GDP-mannose-dependent alpha-(1-6)-phosphatidylinositol monomannoside mannosyltransferase [Vibrio aerogenes CECT 7868]|uniref:GDP-mannose-dependent alpha-(1-6)-phosphatidylinositol monomannoside mannosyltransferase n=1 Tax=Vibrio aerogenes CECT 7868 TaxID=1216006 RepID=A0A1M5ZD74_9VIBR|nr:glycosyltransferase [Vibrio aerogenes]SHI22131.1 GDP-mannose-dependent alpha-(1-6)-phosphatidylinositol monomannoside mannosyltransferase [Vibrio aerogenes CECT 7868]
MKILQVMVHAYAHGFAGGTQKVMIELGNQLAKRGHDITSIYNDTGPGELFFKAEGNARVVNLSSPTCGPFHQLKKVWREITRPLRKTKYSAYFPDPLHQEKAKMLAKPVVQFINQYDPDVILAYGAQDVNSFFAGKKWLKKDVPVIHMTHSDVDVYFSNLTKSDIKNIQNCHAVQALTPDFSDRLQKLINKEVVCIANIVNSPNQFADSTQKSSYPRKKIIMHSRLDKKKQQHMLLESFALIKDQFPDWDVVLFGGGHKDYIDRLHSIISSNHMDHRVSLNGPTSEVEKELCDADLFAFPSVHEEGWGLVLTEAMSVGLPCVGIKSTSAVNYLIQSENAGLVCENDAKQFSLCMSKLMSDTELRKKLGENGRKGMEKYSVDAVCSQWEDLFEKVCSKNQ